MPATNLGLVVGESTNRIINGGMDWFQRSGARTSLNNGDFGADRWIYTSNTTATGALGAIQVTDDVGNGLTANAQRTTWFTDGSTTYRYFTQWIEDVTSLVGKTVTFSIWLKAESGSGTALVGIYQDSSSSSRPANATDLGASGTNYVLTPSLSTTWQRVSFTTTIAAGTTRIGCFAGGRNAVTSFSNSVGRMTQGVLNVGPVAASTFLRAGSNIGDELLLCQRYCQVFGTGGVGVWGSATTVARMGFVFAAQMRGAPAVSVFVQPTFNETNTAGAVVTNRLASGCAITPSATNKNGTLIGSITGFSSATAGNWAFSMEDFLLADAEI